MSRYCYPCIVEIAATTGKASVGQGDGHGNCDNCKAYRRLYRQRTLDDFGSHAAVTPMPTLKKRLGRRVPTPIWFGWSLVLLAIGIALAVLLLSRHSHGVESNRLESWTQAAIHRLPVYYEDKQPGGLSEAKEAQLTAIATAVAKVSQKAPLPPRQWAALLLTIGYHESTFSLRIHAGNCKPLECDRGKARSPWQLHQNVFTREAWPKLQDIENTDAQVWAADRMLRRSVRTCVNNAAAPTVPGILTAYAGRQCFKDWPGLGERLATFGRMNP